jgi:pre-mRNA-splicing factor 38B
MFNCNYNHNNYPYSNMNNNNINNNNINQGDKTFNFVGDPIICNMNNLLLNNILSCQYFKDVVGTMDFFQLIEEITKNVTYAEPWTVGTNGIPSTLFCIIYKFMLMKLTENQVYYLVNYQGNDYVRCAGFLYIRYMSDPKDLWNLFSNYLNEEKYFTPTIDSKNKITFGEYCENLLKEYDYYGTRFNRIPIQIERDIKSNLLNLQKSKIRKIENEKNLYLFVCNKPCRAISFQDNEWHNAKILQNLNNKKFCIYFEGDKEILSTIEATDNKCKIYLN